MRLLQLQILFLIFCWNCLSVQAQFFQTTAGEIGFYSSAPVEDIEAKSNAAVSVINLDNGAISVKVAIRSFKFEKALMQEHFNENYMESDKYPDATFKGKSLEPINIEAGRSQKVIFKGELTVHGKSETRQLSAILNKSADGKRIILDSQFKVKCKDHNIKIPKILWRNIAEEIEVSVNAEYQIIPK
ncbi:YceI family protein [Christiangramia salexigens]|uniref:Lipid/polyisoprenoid-binding YceI-like domain-containing protein n=1 Tax=Christiangramia salexigens TaxID=1913577 RepID=A0A1L3J5V1_9FLAO|nr:YceI family protein [Christiangramia salexigens]APG60493.1 hypothetical protein LPB144_08790 [Christiangramia salexigens]